MLTKFRSFYLLLTNVLNRTGFHLTYHMPHLLTFIDFIDNTPNVTEILIRLKMAHNFTSVISCCVL
jgi:hypothetical protein